MQFVTGEQPGHDPPIGVVRIYANQWIFHDLIRCYTRAAGQRMAIRHDAFESPPRQRLDREQ
jgi:hypothetical protein